MQPLTAMTFGALVLGAAAFIYDATAQETFCSGREASVYFEKGKSEINDFSKAVVERMAAEARTCGIDTVVADADSQRAAALASAFQPLGLKVVPVGSPALAPAPSEHISGRTAKVRLTMSREVS